MSQPDADPGPGERDQVRQFLETRSEVAFLSFYRRHTPRLYGTALRLTGGRDADAQDLVQETWVRAVEHLPGFEWRSALLSWLTSVLLNCWRESVRRDGRELLLSDLPERSTEPAGSADGVDLERALSDLPEAYRAVVVLHDLNGHTHEEIGEMLGVAQGTSKSMLFRARRLLRGGLGDQNQKKGRGTA